MRDSEEFHSSLFPPGINIYYAYIYGHIALKDKRGAFGEWE